MYYPRRKMRSDAFGRNYYPRREYVCKNPCGLKGDRVSFQETSRQRVSRYLSTWLCCTKMQVASFVRRLFGKKGKREIRFHVDFAGCYWRYLFLFSFFFFFQENFALKEYEDTWKLHHFKKYNLFFARNLYFEQFSKKRTKKRAWLSLGSTSIRRVLKGNELNFRIFDTVREEVSVEQNV